MTIQIWFAYVTACIVLSLIPGPSVFIVIGQSLTRGMNAALYCVAGSMFGAVFVMTASYIGLGAVLAASSEAYQIVKWAGVVYLAWLGLSQIMYARRLTGDSALDFEDNSRPLVALWEGFLAGTLNPKTILFHMAFLAQFMNTAHPMTPQFLILMATSFVAGFAVLTGYALLATQARRTFQGLTAQRRMGYVSGSFLLGSSAIMSFSR